MNFTLAENNTTEAQEEEAYRKERACCDCFSKNAGNRI